MVSIENQSRTATYLQTTRYNRAVAGQNNNINIRKGCNSALVI